MMLTCKGATKLISKSQEQPLALKDRVRLKFHLMLCSGCSNYNKQIGLIRKACRHFSE